MRARNRPPTTESKIMTISEIIANDNWSIAEGEHNGKPLYIRFRSELRDRPDLSAYPLLIRIVWKYAGDNDGLPKPETGAQIKALEDMLAQAVQSDQISVLVAAITNSGQREWMFYATDVAPFETCLNDAQQDKDPFPIEVTFERDPKWSAFYEELLGSIDE